MAIEVGQLLDGKYRVLGLIGAGGMGRVYAARHEALGTDLAIKCLLPDLVEAPNLADRFLQEARVSAQLASPFVTRVTDVSRLADGTPFLVMERLHGQLLQGRLDRAGRLELPEAIAIADQILQGLEAAHARGVVHRDLKPENVFLLDAEHGGSEGPHVKLLDFGIAKVKSSSEYQNFTKPGTAMGTPEYMAPEQAYSADEADERSDVYSVGVIVYEMLSGELPVEGSTPLEIANKVIAGAVVALAQRCPELPPALGELVHQAMAPKPEERPGSATQLRHALERFGASSSTRPGHAQTSQQGAPAALSASAAPRATDADRVGASTRPGVGDPGAQVEGRGAGSVAPQDAPDLQAEANEPVPAEAGENSPVPARAGERLTGPAAMPASAGGGSPEPAGEPPPGNPPAGPPAPAAGDGSRAALTEADPFPATEQMDAVAAEAVLKGLAGGVAPTASDAPGSPDPAANARQADSPGGGRAGLVGLVLVGLALAGAVGGYLYWQANHPGPPPAPPRLPNANDN